ncbi:sialoadhesin-like [Limanda limanda]|uniref:sialoadhesin-like n=1 Tax=Limanda limanda TaxID=27771 RepID=UPI0029C91037|nr:sialoadhesin-like [Limanda limanda]
MEAQRVTWLVFLALIKHVSTSDPKLPFELEPGGLLATEGSCSEIKCQVTEDVDDRDAYWFWMKDRRWVDSDKDFTSTVIYSTNNSTHPVSPDFANRVKYIGSPSSSWKNSYYAEPKPLCSILICDLRTSDSGKYSLRFVGGGMRWNSKEVTLNVEVNRCPLTFEEPAVLVESDVVTLTCSTSSSCPSRPHIQDVTQIDRTRVTGSDQDKPRTTFSFKASWQDDGREFSCQTQDNTDKYLIQNITVTVKYSPKHVKVQANPGLDVRENVSLTLSCSAESNPPVSSVTWRKTTDGREEIIQQTQTQTFTVNSASPSDSGLYSCEATNDIGIGKSQPAEVKVRFSPKHTYIMWSAEKKELDGRSSVMLICFSHSFPPVQHYSWYRKGEKNDELVSKHQNHIVYSNQSGVYYCIAENEVDQSLSDPVHLFEHSPKHVTVQANPGLEVKEDVLLTLSCSAESNPPVSSVTWRKTTDGREEIVQQTQTQTFTVNSASPSDSGLYSCEATNDIGSGKSQPAEVKVRFSPKHTYISWSAEKQELDGRSSVMLSCFSPSFPPVQHYSWYRKSQGEEKDELVSKHQNHIVYSNQSGVYHCIAENEVDQSLSDPVHLFERDYLKNLRFLVVPLLLLMIISNEPESLQDYENMSKATARAPTSPNLLDDHTSEGEVELNFPQRTWQATLTQKHPDYRLWDLPPVPDTSPYEPEGYMDRDKRYPPTEPKLSMRSEVTEGQTITVNCTAESFPQSTLTLMRTDTNPQSLKITEKNLYSRISNSLYHKITVTSADAGWYFCRAQNTEGSKDSKEKELVVKYSLYNVKVQANPGLNVKENVLLTLSCSAESNPPVSSVTWRKTTDGREKIIQQTQTQTFRVNSASPSDSGLYSCEATNGIGSRKSQPAEVKVRYPPTEPKLSMRSEVTEGQTITVTCTAESFPQSTLTLMRTDTNPQSLKITEKNLYSRISNSLYHKITVTSADAGWYFCRAQNTEGSKDSKEKELVVKYSLYNVKVQANPGLNVKENVLLTLSCSAESNPPVSSVTWRKTTDGREEIIQQTQTQTFSVNSASPSDSGLYSCEATNGIGSRKSQPAEVKVRFSPKHTHITESAEKQELDGRSSVMLSCFSHSFPPVQHYSWYRKSQGEEKDEIVSKHQNHPVYSNQSGVYYCVAENEVDQTSSDPVHLFERDYLKILKFLFIVPALFVLMIIILIIVILRYRKKKSIQQGTTNNKSPSVFLGWCHGTRRRSLTNENVSAEPLRSRDDLLSEQLRRPEAQRRQPLPDSTPPTDINAVYSILNLPQAASAQNPTRQKAGNTKDDSSNYAPVDFKNKLKKVEEDPVYAKVSKPTRVKKNEPESLQDYENISNATARAPSSPNLHDNHTSEGEVELNFPQVRFTAKPRRQTTNRDSSSSHQDES